MIFVNRQHDGYKGPERIEFPHVTEVADGGGAEIFVTEA